MNFSNSQVKINFKKYFHIKKLIEGEEDNKNRIKNEILSLSILEEIEAEINR